MRGRGDREPWIWGDEVVGPFGAFGSWAEHDRVSAVIWGRDVTDLLSHPPEAPALERKVVVIARAPSPRLWQTLHFRSFKLPERYTWQQLIEPVDRLLEEGWRATRAVLDVGARLPLTPGKRESIARELVRCHGGCELVLKDGSPGYGSVRVELER